MSVSDVCRCCLRDNVRLNSIHQEHRLRLGRTNVSINILEMLLLITQISVDKEDGLPQWLCIPCTKKVGQAYSFRWQTHQSDIVLRSSLQFKNNSAAPLKDENIDNHTPFNADDKLSMEYVDSSFDVVENDNVDKSKSISLDIQRTRKVFNKRNKAKSKENIGTKIKKKNSKGRNKRSVSLKKLRSSKLDYKVDNLSSKVESPVKDESFEDFQCDNKKATVPSNKSDTESTLSKADAKEQYFENEIIESIATLNDADSSSFINKYARDIEDAYFSNNIPINDEQEEILKTDLQIDDNQENWSDNDSNESAIQNKPTKKDRESYAPLYPSPDEPQTCSVCSRKCKNVHSLLKHRTENHPPKRFQCPTCGNGLTTSRGLRLHMRVHTGEKPEVCALCGKSFSDPRTLKNHERLHTGDLPFPCSLCGKRFHNRIMHSIHLRTHTGERPFECPQCDKTYAGAYSLKIHMRTHTGVRPYQCKLCDKAFTNPTAVSTHMLTHSGVKNYQCTVCGKRMARSGELTIHLRTHSGERPFSCNICHKTFTSSGSLGIHMPTHTGVKNFVCTVCGKRVARAIELRVHMRTHTGERSYKCQQCDRRFATNSNLKLHQRMHTGEKPFSCKVCDRRFADSHVLRNHMRTHTGEKPFVCDTCGHAFAQHASLRTHLNTHNKGKNDSVSRETKRMWSSMTKDSHTYSDMIQLNVKPAEFIDDTSLSKILSSTVVDRNGGLNLQECLPVEMSDGASNQVTLVESFDHSLANALPLMNIIPRDAENYISNCASTTMS
ncbi:uncharacterized protein LOC143923264 [Arctopsyche grandis]|uniref:uncharacterized protein LOC143923264 n=1 Tax=Arctopsyche grandis TaxID=121162 RepID=UPI00406DA44A